MESILSDFEAIFRDQVPTKKTIIRHLDIVGDYVRSGLAVEFTKPLVERFCRVLIDSYLLANWNMIQTIYCILSHVPEHLPDPEMLLHLLRIKYKEKTLEMLLVNSVTCNKRELRDMSAQCLAMFSTRLDLFEHGVLDRETLLSKDDLDEMLEGNYEAVEGIAALLGYLLQKSKALPGDFTGKAIDVLIHLSSAELKSSVYGYYIRRAALKALTRALDKPENIKIILEKIDHKFIHGSLNDSEIEARKLAASFAGAWAIQTKQESEELAKSLIEKLSDPTNLRWENVHGVCMALESLVNGGVDIDIKHELLSKLVRLDFATESRKINMDTMGGANVEVLNLIKALYLHDSDNEKVIQLFKESLVYLLSSQTSRLMDGAQICIEEIQKSDVSSAYIEEMIPYVFINSFHGSMPIRDSALRVLRNHDMPKYDYKKLWEFILNKYRGVPSYEVREAIYKSLKHILMSGKVTLSGDEFAATWKFISEGMFDTTGKLSEFPRTAAAECFIGFLTTVKDVSLVDADEISDALQRFIDSPYPEEDMLLSGIWAIHTWVQFLLRHGMDSKKSVIKVLCFVEHPVDRVRCAARTCVASYPGGVSGLLVEDLESCFVGNTALTFDECDQDELREGSSLALARMCFRSAFEFGGKFSDVLLGLLEKCAKDEENSYSGVIFTNVAFGLWALKLGGKIDEEKYRSIFESIIQGVEVRQILYGGFDGDASPDLGSFSSVRDRLDQVDDNYFVEYLLLDLRWHHRDQYEKLKRLDVLASFFEESDDMEISLESGDLLSLAYRVADSAVPGFDVMYDYYLRHVKDSEALNDSYLVGFFLLLVRSARLGGAKQISETAEVLDSISHLMNEDGITSERLLLGFELEAYSKAIINLEIPRFEIVQSSKKNDGFSAGQ